MFINYDLLFKKDLTFEDLNTLIQINQKEDILLEGKDFTKYEDLNLVTYVKTPKEKHLSIRLSKNGKAFLDALSTKGLTEDISNLTEDLIGLYDSYSKETGNHLEIQKRLVWFIEETGFGPKAVKNAVEQYLTDSGDYTMRLDNLIWKGQSLAFSIHFNLKDSKLFDIITKQFNMPKNFLINQNKTVEETWVWDICKLKIPKKLPSELYMTGAYKTEAIFQDDMRARLKEMMGM